MTTLVHVEVIPDQETLHTRVSRDVDDTYYEIPEPLVVAYEQAQVAWQAAQDAVTGYIETHHLHEQQSENW